MSETDNQTSQTDDEHFLEGCAVRTDDGDPVLEFEDGSTIRLDVHVKEWTHEHPKHGETIPMRVDVDADDFAWWTIYPERSTDPDTDRRDRYPEVVMTPEVNPDGSEAGDADE